MQKCRTVEDGVAAVLKVYEQTPGCTWAYRRAGEGDLTDVLTLDGKDYPLFWWRFDTQTSMLHEMAPSREPCSMKLNRSCGKGEGLARLTYREFDIAQWVLRSALQSVMCFENGEARNILGTMENGCVAVFELAAALCDGTEEQGRHTFWGKNGMGSDRVVSQKVPSQATYLFTDDKTQAETYNDVFRCMYGLEKPDVVRACAIAEALMGRVDPAEWLRADAQLRRCLAAVERSAQSGEKEAV
ncbi:MAG: hypothetical protein IJT18_04320 [Oscillospiraceae bacterium]|nr:hypothetical protein [Oscillospiraceae bacterium]